MKKALTLLLLTVSLIGFCQNKNFAEVNGTKIHYITHGKGEPVLLLHNLTASHKMYLPWVDDFPEKYQYIIPDLRGHGLSKNPSDVFRHRDAAIDMYALMNTLGINKFKAIGTSSGAMTLLHMTTMDSTRVEAMILIGGTTHYPEEARNIQKNTTYETIDIRWRKDILYHQPGGENQARKLLRLFKELSTTYEDMNFTSPYLSIIKCPTLIIHGDRDKHFPIDIPVKLYKNIPDSYLWIIPNGGHLPFVHEKEESIWSNVFITVMAQFFEDKKFH